MSQIKRGNLITLEGTEGVGKTTNMAHVCEWLSTRQITYVAAREPGGTVLAEQIRDLLLDNHTEAVAPVTELLLMFASRAQHLTQRIEPALAAGTWVVCDRFSDASYAYQGAGRGIPELFIEQLEHMVQGFLQPNLTLILDIPVSQGLSRAKSRSAPDRFEREQHAFFERVREGYLARAKKHPQRCKMIDASLPLVVVQEQLNEALDAFVAAQPNSCP